MFFSRVSAIGGKQPFYQTQFSVVVARLGSKCYHLTREIEDLGWV